jgi:hypothetical protein
MKLRLDWLGEMRKSGVSGGWESRAVDLVRRDGRNPMIADFSFAMIF